MFVFDKTSYRNQFVGQMWCVGHSLVSPGMVNKNHPQSSYQNVNIFALFSFFLFILIYMVVTMYCTVPNLYLILFFT